MNINDFHGMTAFLNGTEGLHSIDQNVYDKFIEHGHVVKILDNLFNEPEKLINIRVFENLVLYTTGLHPDKLIVLEKMFENYGGVPKNVIFVSEGTALTFCGIARELKNMGTKFWFIDFINFYDLYEIEWI